MAVSKGQITKAKGVPKNDYGEMKVTRTFRLTPKAYNYLGHLAKLHGIKSKAEVIEAIAREDGDLIALPRYVLLQWQEEAKDKTSPRYQRLQQLLEDIKEYLP